MGVLFVVPTGNLRGVPIQWLKTEYPGYLLKEEARLIDPASALNALTVGSLARWDRGHKAWRWPGDLAETPVAQHDQPSPFSRCGCSVNGAIKPELVAYGGNQAIDRQGEAVTHHWLGEVSTSKDFADGRLIAERSGTSFAGPHVAHAAARLLSEVSDASMNLVRALLVANAKIPAASSMLFTGDEDKLAQTVGYGMVDASGLYRSTEEQVILVAEASLQNKYHHFYEVPIPDSFYGGAKRSRRREITVALAHCPPVRTTRIDYKAVEFDFRLVEAGSLENVVKMFNKATSKDEHQRIGEMGTSKSTYGTRKRSSGTVQACTWAIKRRRDKRLFVVVTRNDPAWGEKQAMAEEPYAVVIRLSDRENVEARLYTEIRAQLQVRERARARV